MSRAVEAATVVPLSPEHARGLWTDLERWPSFVEGFGHLAEVRGEWPERGATVVWNSTPGGRGQVTEKVTDDSLRRFATKISEEALRALRDTLARTLRRYAAEAAPAARRCGRTPR